MTTWVLSLVASEKASGLVQVVFPYIDGAWPSLSRDQKHLLELCVLRDPIHIRLHYSKSAFVRELSPGVRTRVFAGGLELTLLNPLERLYLIESHVELLMERVAPISFNEPSDTVRAILRISDMEIAMRDLSDLLFDRFGAPNPYASGLARELLRLFERVSDLRPTLWVAMADCVADLVLVPLFLVCQHRWFEKPVHRPVPTHLRSSRQPRCGSNR